MLYRTTQRIYLCVPIYEDWNHTQNTFEDTLEWFEEHYKNKYILNTIHAHSMMGQAK